MKFVVAFVATLLAVHSHPTTIECFVGDEIRNHVETGFSYCESHHKGAHSLQLTGRHGRSVKQDALFQAGLIQRTHGCSLELNENEEFELKCACATNRCNDPETLSYQLKSRFIQLIDTKI